MPCGNTTPGNTTPGLNDSELGNKRQDAVDEKTKLIIQTPLMYLPNSVIYLNDRPFLELSFNNEDNDNNDDAIVVDHVKWLSSLERDK